MSSGLMDTEKGGEQTQYESIKTVTEPSDSQAGQLGADKSNTTDVDQAAKQQGQKTAENIRYGQGISEGGFGGKTTESTGEAQQAGYGGVGASEDAENVSNSRREQEYGPGTNIGA